MPGIFQRLTVQAGLEYDVAMSARNAATLRGHLLITNPAGWDLRGNIGSQGWDKIALQEQSDEALAKRAGLNSVPDYTRNSSVMASRSGKKVVATRNPCAGDALTDGRIDLWFDDAFHASKHGSDLPCMATGLKTRHFSRWRAR